MRLMSAKGEYAVLAILALALHPGNEPLQVKSIAEKKSLPLRFLEQVMSTLKKKGLVESIRGPHGGYRLTRPPAEIFFGEVLQAVEGPISHSDLPLSRNASAEVESALLTEIWTDVNDTMRDYLDAISFEELCKRKKEKEAAKMPMFHI